MINKRPPLPWSLLRFWWLRILPVWCGMGLIIFLMQIAVCGIVHDNESVKSMLKFMDMLPSFIKAALGGEALQLGWINSAWGIGVVLGGLILGVWGGFRRRMLTSLSGLVGMVSPSTH